MFNMVNKEKINIFEESSVSGTSEYLEATCKPKSADTFSVFGDSNCGEPLLAQHIVIDFTPNDEDNDYVQKKCCAFWDFINNLSQIQHLMVLPESHHLPQASSATSYEFEIAEDERKAAEIEKAAALEKTALSVLEIAEKKGLTDGIFGARMAYKTCSLGSREYKELEGITQQLMKEKPVCQWPCLSPFKPCAKPKKHPPLKTMVKDMQLWDKEHPKSMEPPGHPPSLQHCILQRAHLHTAQRKLEF